MVKSESRVGNSLALLSALSTSESSNVQGRRRETDVKQHIHGKVSGGPLHTLFVFALIGCLVARIMSWCMLWHVEASVGWMQQGRYNGVGCGLTREAMVGCGLTRETITLGEGDLNALSPISLVPGTRSGSTRETVASRREYPSTPSIHSKTNNGIH